jgi:hypothetical protein
MVSSVGVTGVECASLEEPMMMWLVAVAEATPPEYLHPGELYGHWDGWTGTAYTTPKGSFMLHPLIRSSMGVSPALDLKASFLGELFGPHLAFEVAPVQNDKLALSLEARGRVNWGFETFEYGVVPHFSTWLSEKVLLDLSVGFHGRLGSVTDEGDTTGTSGISFAPEPGLRVIRPELSMDLKLSDPLWLILTMRGNALGWQDKGPQGALGAYFAYGKGPIGFSAGGNLAILGLEGPREDVERLEEDLGVEFINLPAAIPIPLPHLQVWFRI